MQSVIIYSAMVISSTYFANRAKNSGKKVYLFCIMLVLTFVCGCRAYSVGNDTKGYFDVYESMIKTGINLYAEMEIGYEWLCRIILLVIPNPQAVFVLVAFITYMLVILRLWEFRDIAEFDWAIPCFIVSFHFFIQSGMRQGLALAVVFWSTRYLDRNRLFGYLIGVAIASLLHKSAIAAFVNVFAVLPLWRKLDIKKQIFLLLCIAVIPIGILTVVRHYTWERYQELFSGNFDIGMRVFIEIGFAVLSVIAFQFDPCMDYEALNKSTIDKKQKCVTSIEYRIKEVRLFYVVGLLIGNLGYISSTLGRMQMYWYWYQPVFMGMLVKSRYNRTIFKCLVIIFMTFLCITSIAGNGYSQVPYLFFWQI